MLFSSLTFLLGFLPIALIATIIVTRLWGARAGLIVLVAASLIFYGWRLPVHALLLIFSILVNFLIGRRLINHPSTLLLTMGVSFNLGGLALFKYAGFFAEVTRDLGLAGIHLPALVLPLGISFFTFQQIAYLVDANRGQAAKGQFAPYAFFVSFFPQLIAGPIVHHKVLAPQLAKPRFLAFRSQDIARGVALFSIGLAKKTLIADPLAVLVNTVFAAETAGLQLSLAEAWIGMIAYAFQIYFDFSGYCDMALGLGLIFGLTLPVNFASPYRATSIIDFWRRWNITLSQFLRDYLYIPLGGGRRGPIRRYANLWIVMLLGGLWHGAGWGFVVWGGLHGAYLTINHFWRRGGWALPPYIGGLLTFVAVVIAWVFFRADGFDQAQSVLVSMFGGGAWFTFDLAASYARLLLPFCAAMIVWWGVDAMTLSERLTNARYGAFAAAALAAVSIAMIFSAGSYEFIYFQF